MKEKEKRAISREEKCAQKRRKRRQRALGKVIIAAALVGLSVYGIVAAMRSANSGRLGEYHAIEGRDHIRPGENHDAYVTNPPTSGAHGRALRWGVYADEIVDENAVHNLEHGGIWLTYKKEIGEMQIAQLRSIAQRHPQSVLLSPRSANDAPIAVASWGRLMKLDAVDEEKIERYIAQNINKSPERLAR